MVYHKSHQVRVISNGIHTVFSRLMQFIWDGDPQRRAHGEASMVDGDARHVLVVSTFFCVYGIDLKVAMLGLHASSFHRVSTGLVAGWARFFGIGDRVGVSLVNCDARHVFSNR